MDNPDKVNMLVSFIANPIASLNGVPVIEITRRAASRDVECARLCDVEAEFEKFRLAMTDLGAPVALAAIRHPRCGGRKIRGFDALQPKPIYVNLDKCADIAA